MVLGRFCSVEAFRQCGETLQSLFAYGAHNHGLTNIQMTKLARDIYSKINTCMADTFNQILASTGGFSLLRIRDVPLHLDRPDRVRIRNTDSQVEHVTNLKPHQKVGQGIFRTVG